MGACTVSITRFTVDGDMQSRYGTITLSSSYSTGGDTITAAQFGLANIQVLNLGEAVNSSNTAQGISLAPNITTLKVQAFGDGGNAPGGPDIEAAPGTNLSTFTAGFQIFGY